jgi:hypothetical protein
MKEETTEAHCGEHGADEVKAHHVETTRIVQLRNEGRHVFYEFFHS